MGMFSLTTELDPTAARRLHMITLEQLLARLETGEGVVVLATPGPNFEYTLPSARLLDAADHRRILDTVERCYARRARTAHFVVYGPRDPGP